MSDNYTVKIELHIECFSEENTEITIFSDLMHFLKRVMFWAVLILNYATVIILKTYTIIFRIILCVYANSFCSSHLLTYWGYSLLRK